MSLKKRFERRQEKEAPIKGKLFQGRIDPNIYDRLLARLEKDGIQHRVFLEEAALAFLEDK